MNINYSPDFDSCNYYPYCHVVLLLTAAYKLKRGLSKTSENFPLVNKARGVVLQDISEGSTERVPQFVETPEYTFMLPNLSQYPDDFRAFLHKDLIETSTLVSLEQAGRWQQ